MGSGVSSRLPSTPRTPRSQREKNLSQKRYFDERYPSDYVLGAGSYSAVLRAVDTDSHSPAAHSFVALKRTTIPATGSGTSALNMALNELNVFRRMRSHPHIVRLHCAFRYLNTCSLVLDYLEGGDMRRLLKN